MIFLIDYVKILLKTYMNKRKANNSYRKSKQILEKIHKIIMTYDLI